MYVSSRHAEIEAMIRYISAGKSDAAPNLPPFPAGAGESVADHLRGVTAREIAVAPSADGLYLDAVEHVRQNRLRRWQKPADPIK